MKEADDIYVLDTGSTDNTVKLLKENNVIVKQKKIKPWRFDIARNESLKMIKKKYDILVCTDLDEIFNPGWRKQLEEVWTKDTNRMRYIYNWSLDEHNNPKVSFYSEKIHSQDNYKWIYPVHEILEFGKENEKIKTTNKIVLNHYPDFSKSRASYLPLLELSVKENPENDRNTHYLGREYMYYGKYNEAIDTLIKHLYLPSSTWKDERSASMRFIARCYSNLNRYDEALMWLDKAIKENPYSRDPYVEKAILFYKLNNFDQIKENCLNALKITTKEYNYINEIFSFDSTIYDLLSIAYYNLGDFKNSLKYVCLAIKMEPKNKRLLENKKIIKKQERTSK